MGDTKSMGAIAGGVALTIATGGAGLGVMLAHAAAGAAAGGLIGEAAGGLMEGPEVPDPVTPDAPVEAGDEGIRSGEQMRQSKRRALGQAYLTKGQTRSGTTLASSGQTLG